MSTPAKMTNTETTAATTSIVSIDMATSCSKGLMPDYLKRVFDLNQTAAHRVLAH
jgi:hypothetical protein